MQNGIWDDKKLKKILVYKSDDDLLNKAIKFIRDTGTMTNNQIRSLENITYSSQNIQEITKFIDHQRDKAEKSGHVDKSKFWTSLKSYIDEIKKDSEEFLKDIQKKEEKNLAQYLIIKEFIQHLAAEHRFRNPGGK